MDITVKIADALKDSLNGTTFSQEFTASRKIVPSFKIKDLIDLTVTTVPKAIEVSMADRCSDLLTVSVDIGVTKKLGRDIETQAEALFLLCGEIVELVTRKSLQCDGFIARWEKTSNDPIYDAGMLEDDNVFMSVITVTYKAIR